METERIKKILRIAGPIAVAAFACFGRYPVSWLLSAPGHKARSRGSANSQRLMLSRPYGNTVYVEIEGPQHGQPVVLLHGLNSDSRQWFRQRDAFSKRYRLVLIDLAGHGRSPRPADLSVAALAADLQYVITQLGLKNPILYGHSLGSMVIMKYLKRNLLPAPAAAVLQQSSYTNPLKHTIAGRALLQMQKLLIEPYLRLAKKIPFLFRLIGWTNYFNGLNLIFYRYLFFTGNQSAGELRYVSRLAAQCPPEVVAEGILQLTRFDVTEDLRRIMVPCLVVGSASDRVCRPIASLFESDHIPGAALGLLPGGHLSIIEYPEDNNRLVGVFLRQHANKDVVPTVPK
ncbi:alpha/beta fold hydrolase [Pedobacter sp. SYP-B3415]|uniref:alpha/beta fold hydrolase n=1 Tax=Pedobacter sp. SYP-B3415 TaxID=2496641 RepID=UPI00101D5398|nr:alpha/beta hydrolase [Pedobacter sp. SYP-B3415]